MSAPLPARSRFPLLAAAFFGLTGVSLGALGAHALAAKLAERGTTHGWQTAAHYQLFHALALLGAAAWLRTRKPIAASTDVLAGARIAATRPGANAMLWAGRLWAVGILLFSGSLYGLALGGPRWLGPVTPFGGVALMLGWLMAGIAALANDE
jgi:uncharacterized membrane protein YgdD (TMEM256/DUF423 family)